MPNYTVTVDRGYGSTNAVERGYSSTNAVERGDDVLAGALRHQRTTEHYAGNLRRIGVSWIAGRNYTSNYNWSIENWEGVGGVPKRLMRGGPILLNRVVLVIIMVGALLMHFYYNTQDITKFYFMSAVFIGLIYVINTIWNWYIFTVNGNRIHPHMFHVSDYLLPGSMNEFYEIPIHTTITDQHTLVIFNQFSALIAQLIQQNQSSTSIEIMIYGNRYLKEIRFPVESIVVFLGSIAAIVGALYSLWMLW